MKARTTLALLGMPLALAACATARPAGPIEVTRFVDTESRAQLGNARLFVETAPGSPEDGLALAPYKQAVARELARYGYAEEARVSAGQTASVSVERATIDERGRRGPVSVGAGGSTGSYGGGVGLGIGFNLGGGGSGERVVTRMEVRIRDQASGTVLWEGRARLDAPAKSPLAQSEPAAAALADALFRGFPGNNGETIEVEIDS